MHASAQTKVGDMCKNEIGVYQIIYNLLSICATMLKQTPKEREQNSPPDNCYFGHKS